MKRIKIAVLAGTLIALLLLAVGVITSTWVLGIDTGGAFIHNNSQNLRAKYLIAKILFREDAKAFKEFSELWCGGGSGCYDLGYAILQILDRLGDQKFCALLRGAQIDKLKILNYLRAGAEYGDPKGIQSVRLTDISELERPNVEKWGSKIFPETMAFLGEQ